ncbi:hypothetical protein [Roseicyclus marinus]|uniref:hypothetical protein n=1 Tax=Roseicyclus marinus TaxID=2161673 RepID=UPI00240FD1AB|nr:hypothetical protein [Roseicyclus marinus]MDG3039904.1 hypothetical protein [Roseicyclus marinus]
MDRTASGVGFDDSAQGAWVLRLDGPISQAMARDTAAAADRIAAAPEGRIVIVLLGSVGGDAHAAMQIGTILRQLEAHVFVTSRCDSACLFILASGVLRHAPAFSIGIHRAQIIRAEAGLDPGAAPPVDPDTERAAMARFEAEALAYLDTMGVDPGLLPLMQGIDTIHVRRLPESDLIAMGLLGMDDAYLASILARMLPDFRAAQGRVAIAARVRSIGSQCGLHFDRTADFVECHLSRTFASR